MFIPSTRFIGQNERRNRGDIQLARIDKAGFLEPLAHFGKCKRVARFGHDQHIDGKDQRVRRTGAVIIRNEFLNGNDATGSECVENFLQQTLAAFDAFAVQDMTDGRNLMAVAEVSFGDGSIRNPG